MAGTYHSKFHGFNSNIGAPEQKTAQTQSQVPTRAVGGSLEDSLKSALRRRNIPKICASCNGKLRYTSRGRYVCEECSHELVTNYGKVRDFLDVNNGATIIDVCEATGLSRREVKELIDDGSIQIVGGRTIASFE